MVTQGPNNTIVSWRKRLQVGSQQAFVMVQDPVIIIPLASNKYNAARLVEDANIDHTPLEWIYAGH